MIRTLCTIALIASLMGQTKAQSADNQTVDGIISTLYGVISGPAGERDWDQFRSLFKPNAIMGAMSANADGDLVYRPMTPASYIKNNGPFFLENGFWEKEIGRELQQFGEVAHVYSAYEFEMKGKDETIRKRGINSIQLIYDMQRWWIVSIQWDSEREGNSIPSSMIKK